MRALRDRAGAPARADYSDAVYGSLLAASVIAGTGSGDHPIPARSLVALLLATGLVFWLAHVYARLTGDRARGAAWEWTEIRAVGSAEWPLVQAAFPPAAVACAGWLLELADATTAWLALLAALAGQVGWGVAASLQVGAPARTVVVSGLVNLFLGLAVVALKTLLSH
ncbi:hypothetical protein [Spirillospora sp. CA-128828]|uniref:hypothetical protein n=1 Tax=Spirillospora sp. CA-128828 TaxID=3240033 RepID=UPI003D8BD268